MAFKAVEEALELYLFVLGALFLDVAELFLLAFGAPVGFEVEGSGEGVDC